MSPRGIGQRQDASGTRAHLFDAMRRRFDRSGGDVRRRPALTGRRTMVSTQGKE
jgi:hypothetical protein